MYPLHAFHLHIYTPTPRLLHEKNTKKYQCIQYMPSIPIYIYIYIYISMYPVHAFHLQCSFQLRLSSPKLFTCLI